MCDKAWWCVRYWETHTSTRQVRCVAHAIFSIATTKWMYNGYVLWWACCTATYAFHRKIHHPISIIGKNCLHGMACSAWGTRTSIGMCVAVMIMLPPLTIMLSLIYCNNMVDWGLAQHPVPPAWAASCWLWFALMRHAPIQGRNAKVGQIKIFLHLQKALEVYFKLNDPSFRGVWGPLENCSGPNSPNSPPKNHIKVLWPHKQAYVHASQHHNMATYQGKGMHYLISQYDGVMLAYTLINVHAA